MTAEELLATMTEPLAEDGTYCTIDPETRVITIPPEYQLLGVESDEKAERLYFKCPKIVGDNIDLTKLALRVNFRNAGAVVDQYLVDDVAVDGDNITFSWLLSRRVTQYEGTVNFIVCAVKVSGEEITNEWNTTLAEAEVLEGLEVEVVLPEDETDIVNQLLALAETRLNDVRDATSAANTAASNANQKAQEAENAAEDARGVIEQITKDSYLHTALQSFIDTVTATPTAYGNAVVKKIEGFTRQERTQGLNILNDTVQNEVRANCVISEGGKIYKLTTDRDTNAVSYCRFALPFSLDELKGRTVHSSNYTIEKTEGLTPSVSIFGIYSNGSPTVKIGELSSGGNLEIPENLDSQIQKLEVLLYADKVGQNKTGSITYKNLWLSLDEPLETWEPYTGGQPAPNPDYPMEVQGTGKKKDAGYAICVKSRSRNMIPFPYKYVSTTASNGVKFVSDSTGRYYLNGNASESTSVVRFVQNYTSPDDFEVLAELENGKEYYAKDVQVFIIHADGTNNTINAMQTAQTYVGKSGDRIAGFRALVVTSGSYTPDRIYEPIFCEKGEDNSFVPPSQYNVTYIPVDYPLFEGDKIIQRNGEYKLLRKMGFKTYDGSDDENWNITYNEENNVYNIYIADMMNDGKRGVLVPNNYFYNSEYGYALHSSYISSSGNYNIMISPDMNIDTVQEWKDWLKTHTMYCAYKLATPTEEPLSSEAQKALHSIMATDEQTELTIVGVPSDETIQNQFLLPRNEDGALNTTAYCTAEKNKIVLNELVAQNLDARVNKLEIDNATLAEQTIVVE